MLSYRPRAFSDRATNAQELVLLTGLRDLAEDMGGELERLVVSPGPLIIGGECVERADGIMLAGARYLEEIQEATRLVELALGHLAQGDGGAGLRQLGLEAVGQIVQLAGLLVRPGLLELGGQAGHQLGVGGEPIPDDLPEPLRLFGLVETEQRGVHLQRGRRRGVPPKLVLGGRDLELAGLLVGVGTGHEMPGADRTGIDHPLPSQGDDRDEDDHEPEARVVGFQARHPAARPAGGGPDRAVLPAVIVRTDAIDGRGHDV